MKLHLGCGKRHISGFVHVDVDDFPHVDVQHDIRRLPMFEDDSVELIYACHALEYFDRTEVLEVLREWGRVLQPGGTLRVAVPDFASLIEVYRDTQDLALIHGPLYGRIVVKTNGREGTLYHRTVYDFNALRQVLESAGFTNVRRYDWQETPHRDVDDFSQAYVPHMQKATGRLISLNVEATKPVKE